MPPKRTPSNRVTKSKAKPTRTGKSASGSSPPLTKNMRTKATPSGAQTCDSKASDPEVGDANAGADAGEKQYPEAKDGPVYFWRPDQGNGYLGQWFWSKWEVDGDTYATAEMWMMVCKARLFGDEAVAREMLDTTDPKKHKALGREVRNFDQAVWDLHKRRIVEEGNVHKFTLSEDAERLREMLLATGNRELVEASPRDRIWGIGFGEKNAGANRHRWGKNLLGKALMDVRDKLREDGKKAKEDDGKGED